MVDYDATALEKFCGGNLTQDQTFLCMIETVSDSHSVYICVIVLPVPWVGGAGGSM